MISLLAAVWILAFAAIWAGVLRGAKLLGRRWPVQEGPPLHAVFGAVWACGLGALWWLRGWPQLAVAAALSISAVYRAAVGLRGSGQRSRYALLELYLVFVFVAALCMRGAALLSGTRASPSLAFAVHEVGSRFSLALTRSLADHVASSDPRLAAALRTELLQGLLDNWAHTTAFVALGIAWCTASYLAYRTMARPGRSLVPGVVVFGPVWAIGMLAHPSSPPAWLAVVLAPLLAAEGIRTLADVSRPLAARTLVVAAAALAMIVSRQWAVAMIAVGWLAGSLRPWLVLGPRLASDESARVRPTAIVVFGVAAACGVLLSTSFAYSAFASASPLVGAPSRICHDIRRAATERTVEFSSASARFTIDREETASPVALTTQRQAAAVCERENKRLCTSDEWYLACLCTYPTESRPGAQTTGNELLGHAVARGRSDLQRRNAEAAVYGLLDGKSEVVAPLEGSAVWIAGANDAIRDDRMTDCRYRAALTEPALAENGWAFVGVRCCR